MSSTVSHFLAKPTFLRAVRCHVFLPGALTVYYSPPPRFPVGILLTRVISTRVSTTFLSCAYGPSFSVTMFFPPAAFLKRLRRLGLIPKPPPFHSCNQCLPQPGARPCPRSLPTFAPHVLLLTQHQPNTFPGGPPPFPIGCFFFLHPLSGWAQPRRLGLRPIAPRANFSFTSVPFLGISISCSPPFCFSFYSESTNGEVPFYPVVRRGQPGQTCACFPHFG